MTSKKILIVCIANYCRSPVVEKILQSKLTEKIQVTSAGIAPFPRLQMDPRSSEYLKSKNLEDTKHIPKRVSKKILDENDTIIAMDEIVLIKIYESIKDKSKIKLFNAIRKDLIIDDPYKLKDKQEYFNIMDKIFEGSNIWVHSLSEI